MNSQILSKEHFLSRLWMEKRRSERSRAPLSIALFYFDDGEKDQFQKISSFLGPLQKKTRETDCIGWLDRNVLGLILPDTNETGLQTCIGKIFNGNGSKAYSVVTGTYPDQVFQKILADEKPQPDLFPFVIEEAVRPRLLVNVLKRGLDILGALMGIALFSPVMLLTALTVKLTSPGPVIFKQDRLGKEGARFSFYKFRSMYADNDDAIHRKYVHGLIEGDLQTVNQGDDRNPLYKIKSDPRVTAVGRIIRKLSIDELPQFFNVLKGEMSLVGPRPPLPYEVEKYKPWHLRRILEVKPGITGLWQVEGRSRTSFDDMVRLDLRYVQQSSLRLDLKILLKTVNAVLKPSGAH